MFDMLHSCSCSRHMLSQAMQRKLECPRVHQRVHGHERLRSRKCSQARSQKRALCKSRALPTTSTPSSRRALLLQGLTIAWACGSFESHAMLVDEGIAEDVFDTTSPSVVSVVNYQVLQGAPVFEGVGSGIVWDEYGHVVTNYHCIAKLAMDRSGRQVTQVAFNSAATGGTATFDAVIAGTDAYHDLAVLKVDAPANILRPVKIGTSSDAKVGQYVYAIGNPYGLSQTMSVGVIGGLNRSMPSPGGNRIYDVIQTDAPINAGNSGGGLFDSFGRLLGICTATYTSKKAQGRGSGVNFALPVDTVRDIVPKLIVYGSATGKR